MLIYGKCSFRKLKKEDLERVLKWRNSDRVRENMYTDRLITLDEHQAWFERMEELQTSQHFIFEYCGIPLGIVNITQIDSYNQKCSWGFYIGEVTAPPKSGLAMGYFAINYIFEELNIRKICAEAFAFNKASICYHQRLGFETEGIMREHVIKKQCFEDIMCFALFNNQWQTHKLSIYKESFGEKNA